MKDLFSSHARDYVAFRPHYPQELFAFIYSHVKNFSLAWDAGTGNGQAAVDLARKFELVHATDISKKQLDESQAAANIRYEVGGETVALPDHSVDLIAVAQAIHWFDREKFYAEVMRVSKPGTIVAVWGYGLLSVSSEIDRLVREFYTKVVGPYWDPERKLIDESYRTIAFPFKEVPNPGFRFITAWTLDQLEGYLSTWSSVQNYIRKNGNSPVHEWVEKISAHWCPSRMRVTFEVFARVGKVE